MNVYRRSLAGALIATVIALAGAQETSPPARPPADPPASPPADPPAAPRESTPRADDDVFIPTEEVQADEELAFPVDI